MAKTISKDTALAEITLRKYEKPENLSKRELVRKLCLSIGLLQPGDSRDIVVDVLYAILEAREQNLELSSEEIEEKVKSLRKKSNLSQNGSSSPNIRRQLKRLKNIFIIESIKNKYRLKENLTILEIFKEKIEKFHVHPIIARVEEYFYRVNEGFKKS